MNSGALDHFQLHHYYFVCRTMIGENDTRCVSVHVHIDIADICIKFQNIKNETFMMNVKRYTFTDKKKTKFKDINKFISIFILLE